MTVDPRLEHALPKVLADLGSGGQPAYTERLLERTARTRQRPAWVFVERWLLMDVTAARSPILAPRWRLAAVATLLVIALVVIAIVAGVGSGPRLPPPFGLARNGTIAYSTNGDIYASNIVTDNATAIVAGPTFDFRSGYSPDGSMLGFLRRVDPAVDGLTALMVAQSDGSAARIINDVPLKEPPALWQWSSDSRSIVLITIEGTYSIFDATRRGPASIVDTGDVAIESPVFQPPTGERVLFRGSSPSGIGLYVMDADGSNLLPLIAPARNLPDDDLQRSAWSPDGRQIAFQRVPLPGLSQRLFVMNSDGSGAHVIAAPTSERWDGYPSWSPDGSRIAFGRYDPTSNTYITAVLSVADGTVTTIGPTIDGNVSSVGYWSPDGEAFLLVYSEGVGLDPVVLDPDGGPDRPVAWSAVAPIDWQRLAP